MSKHNCDICGSCGNYVNFRVSEPWKSSYPVSYCTNCDLYFLSERPEANEIIEYYKKYYKCGYLTRIFKQLVRHIRVKFQYKTISNWLAEVDVRKIMEFGSPDGLIAKQFKTTEKKCVVDYSLLNDLKATDVDYFTDISKVANRKFDLIIASHVIEHFVDFKSQFNDLLNCLEVGGYIYIEVPLSPSLHDELLPRYLNTDHFLNFGINSIAPLQSNFNINIFQHKLYSLNDRFGPIGSQVVTEGVGTLAAKIKALFVLILCVVARNVFVDSKSSKFIFGKNISVLFQKRC